MPLSVEKCILLCIICFVPECVLGFCSTDFENDPGYPYRKYQDITAYDDSGRGDIRLYNVPNGCEPLGMIFAARHGSRYRTQPNEAENFAKLEDLQEKLNLTGKAKMCPEDLKDIKLWRNWFHPDLKSDLTKLGYEEMTELGKRFSSAFPQLFSEGNNIHHYSSNFQRTRESARVFMENTYNSSRPIIVNNTIVTGLMTSCKRYMKEIWTNPNITTEANKFAKGDVFVKMASDIAERLGVPETEIDYNTITTLYVDGCAEQVAVDGKDSPWCLVFTADDIKALEYRGDMADYMKHGYGTEISYKSGCVTKRFVLDGLKSISDGNVVSHFINGHGWMLLRLLTDMKLIEDEGPLTAKDHLKQLNRKFQSSRLAPNGGNLVFLVNRCNAAKKLQVFHNERPVPLPLKNPVSDGMLDLETALEYFGYNDPNDCNWDDICSLDRVTTTSTTASAIYETTVQGIGSSRTESGPNKTLKETILDILSIFRDAFMHYTTNINMYDLKQ